MKYFASVTFVVLAVGHAGNAPATIYLRLKFDHGHTTLTTASEGTINYLRGKQVVVEDKCWAMESIPGDTWRDVEELPRKTKIGLALAGGGDRGIAHIGVLRALEENSIPIHAIAGTSMGAIVGGFYACGYSVDALDSIVRDSIDWRSIFSDHAPHQYLPMWERVREKPREPGLNWNLHWNFRWWPPRSWLPSKFEFLPGSGLRTAQKFIDEIAIRTLRADYYAGFDFTKLPIPFGAMLTNMTYGKNELKLDGTVATAARASGSLPLIFEPMKISGVEYVDGMVLDNLPVDAFRVFDSLRAPAQKLTINGNDVDFVIAVDPIKRKGTRDEPREKPELAGSMGLSVMNKTSTMARDIYIWQSWDSADARIDIDVEGNFDFSPEQLEDKIRKGYDAGLAYAHTIKWRIAAKEAALDSSRTVPWSVYQVMSVRLSRIAGSDTSEVRDTNEYARIHKAVRIKTGALIEKADVCDVLRRIYCLGDFENVMAKMVTNDWMCTIDFLLENKPVASADTITFKYICVPPLPQEIQSKIDSTIRACTPRTSRTLDFNEIKHVVEWTLVDQGYVCPRVDSVTFACGQRDASVFLSGLRKIAGVKVLCGEGKDQHDTTTARVLSAYFNAVTPSSPDFVLSKMSALQRQFFLKTIHVQGMEGDSLVIACERKASHTLEIPALSLENTEGITLFIEARAREWHGLSPYINYCHNFPLKRARQLPHGQEFGLGFGRCSYKWYVPEFGLRLTRLTYSSIDSTIHDTQREAVIWNCAFPFYPESDLAIIPCIEASQIENLDIVAQRGWDDVLSRAFVDPFTDLKAFKLYPGLRIAWDRLDKVVFPEQGLKIDLDAKGGLIDDSVWLRLRVRGVVIPVLFRIKSSALTVLTLQGSFSWFRENTPLFQRYSLGGHTPIGSYQLRRYEHDDLPGYDRDEFIEPWLWKFGGSLRVAVFELSPLDLRVNGYVEGGYYLANAVSSREDLLDPDRIKHCTFAGLYVDMSYFNIGLCFEGSEGEPFNKLHLSLVYYGLGL